MFPWVVRESAPCYSVGELLHSYRAARLLIAAARLELFTRLEGKALKASEVARQLCLPPKPVGAFLDALAALGYLRKKDERYSNTAFAQRNLIHDEFGAAFTELDDLLSATESRRAELAPFVPPGARRILVVGPEPEPLVRALERARPQARVAVDKALPRRGGYDLVVLSQALHSCDEQANRALVADAGKLLRPRGRLIVHGLMGGGDAFFNALYSAHMPAFTAGGRLFTIDEHVRWLRDAGLRVQQRVELGRAKGVPVHALVAASHKA